MVGGFVLEVPLSDFNEGRYSIDDIAREKKSCVLLQSFGVNANI